MKYVGKSVPRVDAEDKVTGRAKYTEDFFNGASLTAKIYHSKIANGRVVSIDKSAAEKIPGVVKIVTCFDVPKIYFATAGHPWSNDPSHRDVEDRLLLTDRPRFVGDDVAAVIAEDEVSAKQAIAALKVEYDEYPFVLDPREAMKEGAPLLHEKFERNILGHSQIRIGDLNNAVKEPGLRKFEGWYDSPMVQHCHLENHICYANVENGKITVVSSTQIPHIVRRITAQALGLPWGRVRIIKPYIGGGFGNKQDALYEPLCAYLSQCAGGRRVKIDVTREETFVSNRVRHAIRYHIISWVRPDGTFAARKAECFSNQGAYASHGHGIAAKGMGSFPQLYPCANVECDAYTVFTNMPVAGAMRGYGLPQAMFAVESHTEEIALAMGIDPVEFRRRNLMPVGYKDAFSGNVNWSDTFNQALDLGAARIDFDRKRREYAAQTGDIRRGVGCAVFWYNTAVWPLSLEASSCRMVLNQDGSVQIQLAETEIGQGADTVFSQMTADTLGIPIENVFVISAQDTDVTPYGTGAYGSRQTYVGGAAIKQTAEILRAKILDYARNIMKIENPDLRGGEIFSGGKFVMTLGDFATRALYSMDDSVHFSAEHTTQISANAYSFGACFAEVEVDIPMCKVKLTDIVNVHDCGSLINPALAEAQVHGGMSMGIGYALSEQLLADPKTGKILNDNFLDYKLSTAMDHPNLQAIFIENPEPTSAFGTKALGEPPACPVAPAIRNAILNATGVAVNRIPITAERLFERFTEEGMF